MNQKEILDGRYSDIILIFDLDPQDPQFSGDKISEMMKFFNESSDMGKLYINYPMVEAFYHMKAIPDEKYKDYIVSLDELSNGTYKQRVNFENRNHNYSKFATTREECNKVISQNIDKAWTISGKGKNQGEGENPLPDLGNVLNNQILKLEVEHILWVLCTCAFYIVDYNSKFIYE